MKNKTLSLCITCYDADYHLLDNLLNEVKKQTVAPDELIISSSGMKEDSLMDIKTILISDKEVPVISVNSPERHSEGQARNEGAEKSNMEVIQFFDVDDIPHPQRIEMTKEIFNNYDCDALVHSYQTDNKKFNVLTFETGKVFKCWWNPDNGLGGGQLRANQECNIAHGPITIKKYISENVKYHYDRRSADCKFAGELMKKEYNVFYYDEILMNYNL
jgi:glycosyltransferase involved in cell wall biosynthesis